MDWAKTGKHWESLREDWVSAGEHTGSMGHHENSPCPEVHGNHPMWDVHLHGAVPVWGRAGGPGGLLGAGGPCGGWVGLSDPKGLS